VTLTGNGVADGDGAEAAQDGEHCGDVGVEDSDAGCHADEDNSHDEVRFLGEVRLVEE